MKIVVCGGGQVGLGIARQLIKENNDVTIIDENEANIKKIRDTLEVTIVKGFPAHPNILDDAGVSSADMIIAVTTSDEVNMVICQIAHSLFNVPLKIARLRNRNYLDPIWQGLYRKDHLPIDYIISPELEVAKAIINRLHAPGAMDCIDFSAGKIKVIEIRCDKNFPLNNMTIAEIKDSNKSLFFNIISIYRKGKAFLPKLTDKLYEGDEVFLVCESTKVPMIMTFFGHFEVEARKLVIVGGGNIGYLLAEKLSDEEGLSIKIIEMDKARAEKIASRLEGITIINGNALDKEIMVEAGIENTETVIAVTDDDEVNILSCILAKKSGCKSSICLINKGRSYLPLISSLGIDVDVNPRETTVSTILQHIRKGKVKAVHSLYSGSMEIIETTAISGATIIGKNINDLDLPDDVRIIAIIDDEGRVFEPSSNSLIKENNNLLIICNTEKIEFVDKIFSDSKNYF